jgi:hypothetical protein
MFLKLTSFPTTHYPASYSTFFWQSKEKTYNNTYFSDFYNKKTIKIALDGFNILKT